jgi:hypothetical protein
MNAPGKHYSQPAEADDEGTTAECPLRCTICLAAVERISADWDADGGIPVTPKDCTWASSHH